MTRGIENSIFVNWMELPPRRFEMVICTRTLELGPRNFRYPSCFALLDVDSSIQIRTTFIANFCFPVSGLCPVSGLKAAVLGLISVSIPKGEGQLCVGKHVAEAI